eukprot:gene43806-58383_t
MAADRPASEVSATARPLTKKLGVPWTPAAEAPATSARMPFSVAGSARQ